MRHVAVVFALVLFAFSGSPARAQSEPTVAVVEDAVKAAFGTLPPNERIATSYTRRGLAGSDVRVRIGDDYRVDETDGPFRSAYGVMGKIPWRQNENGETVRDATLAREAVDEKFATTMTHVRDPDDRYVIARLTPGGTGSRTYIDPVTWHVVRVDRITRTETSTTTYSDFRTTAGYTRPWHREIGDRHEENGASYTIQSITTGDVAATDLSIPPMRRALVEFPAGQTQVRLPVHLDPREQKFIVRVTIAGRGLDFYLDTGAGGITIDRDVAQSLGLTEYGGYSTAATAGRFVGTTTIVKEMDVGPLAMRDVVVSTIPHVDDTPGDYRVVGLLGFDFLDAIGAKLDYADGSITAYEASTFTAPPITPQVIDLKVKLGAFVPETSVTINGSTGTRFILDTGGLGAVLVFDYFRRRFPQAVVDERGSSRDASLSGVGGGMSAKRITIAELQLGTAKFDHFGAFVLNSPSQYASNEDGLVGPELFSLFTMYLDYQHDEIYLVPS